MYKRISISILAGLAGLLMLTSPAAASESPLTWSAPKSINAGNPLAGVSCSSETSCAAVGYPDTAVTYDGSAWSAAVSIDPQLTAVSCASAAFCAAVDEGGNALTYNGSAWSAPVVISSSRLNSVSCASEAFCVAVDNEGNAMTYDGSAWSAPVKIESSSLISVSCASEAFCVAVRHGGGAMTYDGSTWSAGGMDPYVTAVSCASAVFCAEVDENGYASTYDGSEWSVPVATDGYGLTAVSCASESFCAAVDGVGNALTYDGSTWSEPVSISPSWLNSVSCVSESFCAAVDNSGNVMIGTLLIPKFTLALAKSGTGAGTIKSKPAGIKCVATCRSADAAFYRNATVILTATPATTAGSTFAGWTGCTTITSKGACAVTMTEAQSVTAEFGGTRRTITEPQVLTVTKGGGSGSGKVASKPAGITCEAGCSATESEFKKGAVVILTETAPVGSGSTFTGWTGCDIVTGEGKCQVTMTEAKSVTATFSFPPRFTLTLTKSGTGAGTVSSKPVGIKCAAACSFAKATFYRDATVILTATPATTAGSTFTGWTGCDTITSTSKCVVTMNTAKEVTAEFGGTRKVITEPQVLDVQKYGGSGSAKVTSKPAGITCEAGCSATESEFKKGTVVTLTETAPVGSGSEFTGWTGCTPVIGEGNKCTVTMTEAKSVTATFGY